MNDYQNHENLSTKQQADFEHAEVNARYANNVLNTMRVVAIDNDTAGFKDAENDFGTYQRMASVLMPPRAAFETKEPTEPFASEKVWGAMSPEQRARAAELRTAIVASELKEHGVSEDTLRVVMTETDGKQAFHLIHTGSGVDIGDPKKEYDKARSYKAVMSPSNDALFVAELNGIKYDTRTGMTDEVYNSKVADARERGVTLPDSEQLSKETEDDWTWTMLTGEKLTAGGGVPVRSVFGGGVYRRVGHPGIDDRVLRVCPAVEIK